MVKNYSMLMFYFFIIIFIWNGEKHNFKGKGLLQIHIQCPVTY